MNEILHDITLRNFRSYSEASYEFEDGVNIIVGPNASGKTNLLEAVHCICFGKGLRGSDSGMIRHGEDWLRLESHTGENTRTFTLEKDLLLGRSKKKITINSTHLKRMKFESMIPVVVFQPDDMRLTSGSPERRRDYLNRLISQLSPTYKSDIVSYERILKQRNYALKSRINNIPEMFAWNLQLAHRGEKIVRQRREIIEDFNNLIKETYSLMAGTKFDINLTYNSNISSENYSEKLLVALERNTGLDLERGSTSVGPHRDDVGITINGRNMKDVASRGENRTLVLALKIIELEMLEGVHNKKPLLLLDDVFSELDGLRRKMLTKQLEGRQSILTTTNADVINYKAGARTNIIAI